MIQYQQWIKTSMHYLYITWQEEEEARAVFSIRLTVHRTDLAIPTNQAHIDRGLDLREAFLQGLAGTGGWRHGHTKQTWNSAYAWPFTIKIHDGKL
jgi:hypothetical protein